MIEGNRQFAPHCSELVGEFADRGSADAIAGILEGENVHTKVEPYGSAAGIPFRWRVLVDPREVHRARWILQESDLTDRELSYLATGQFDEEPGE